MKKKYSATSKDKSDWLTFVKNIGNLASKDEDDVNNDIQKNIPISVAVKPNLIDSKYRWHQNWQDWL